MGEFNSDEHYIYYYEQDPLKGGVTIIVSKSLNCSTWMKFQKRQNDLCSFPRKTVQ